MILTFKTPTRMSLLDVTSMGDSSKRGDTTTIGQFDSGLKYAIALLLRNNVGIRIKTDEDEFSFSTNPQSYGDGKEKELIVVHSLNHGDIVTGFAKNLGYNWELYMAFRELYSNMLDEGGVYYEENREFDGKGTEIYLEFDEENPFFNIYQNRHLYVNESASKHVITNKVSVLENKENYLRIYKNNILVYEDKDTPSFYAYNISFGEIDERRIISNLYTIKRDICWEIAHYCKNEDFLKEIINNDFQISDKDWLMNGDFYSDVSDEIISIASSVCNFKTFNWLNTAILKNPKVEIVGKTFSPNTIYRNTVTLESVPIKEEEILEEKEISFKEQVFKMYKFDIEDVEIKKAKLKGNKSVSDKYNNCIIVSEDFDLEEDFYLFLVEWFIFHNGSHNIINILAREFANKLKL